MQELPPVPSGFTGFTVGSVPCPSCPSASLSSPVIWNPLAAHFRRLPALWLPFTIRDEVPITRSAWVGQSLSPSRLGKRPDLERRWRQRSWRQPDDALRKVADNAWSASGLQGRCH